MKTQQKLIWSQEKFWRDSIKKCNKILEIFYGDSLSNQLSMGVNERLDLSEVKKFQININLIELQKCSKTLSNRGNRTHHKYTK